MPRFRGDKRGRRKEDRLVRCCGFGARNRRAALQARRDPERTDGDEDGNECDSGSTFYRLPPGASESQPSFAVGIVAADGPFEHLFRFRLAGWGLSVSSLTGYGEADVPTLREAPDGVENAGPVFLARDQGEPVRSDGGTVSKRVEYRGGCLGGPQVAMVRVGGTAQSTSAVIQ